jgi:hypothetical protein
MFSTGITTRTRKRKRRQKSKAVRPSQGVETTRHPAKAYLNQAANKIAASFFGGYEICAALRPSEEEPNDYEHTFHRFVVDFAGGSCSRLALQQKLGVLPKRTLGADPAGCADHVVDGAAVIISAGRLVQFWTTTSSNLMFTRRSLNQD